MGCREVRVVIVVPYGVEESGIVVFMCRLEQEFARHGIVTTLLLKGTTQEWMGRTFSNFATSEELSSWLSQRSAEYDVVFWAGFSKDLQDVKRQVSDSVTLRRQLGKSVFFLWERTGEEDVLPDPGMVRQLCAAACDGILVLNEQQKGELLDLSVPIHLVHVSPPGIDCSEFRPPCPLESHQIRGKLGWNLEKVIALYVGRFVRRKRVDFIIKVWLDDEALARKADLVLVGSGFGHRSSIEREVHELASLSQSIFVVPHDGQSDRTQFYRAADFAVLPGTSEGEPSVLSESMASGLPVVASNIPGHRGLVQPNKTGLLFEVDNQQELRQMLHLIVDNRAYRHELGRAARSTAVRQRDISAVAERLLRVFSGGTT